MEKAITARIDVRKKEGLRWSHVAWRRETETRVPDVTRNFGAEALVGGYRVAARHGRVELRLGTRMWAAARNVGGTEAMAQVREHALELIWKLEMGKEIWCFAGSSGLKPCARGSTPRGAKTGERDGDE